MENKMKKIRLSHSLISVWERGDIQGAIDLYFHVDRVGTPAMEDGKRLHDEIAESIKNFKTLPNYMDFKAKFKDPKPEFEIVVPYNEICDLKGVIDCLDEPIFYEWKTGVSDSLEWARTGQIPLYFLLCELKGIKVDSAYLVRFNQHTNKTDFTIVHNSRRLRDKARNIVDTVCFEIHQYFLDQGLL
jgi:hypothetical protein